MPVLLLFDDVNSWVQIDDKTAVKIDYMSPEQQNEIDRINRKRFKLQIDRLAEKGINIDKASKDELIKQMMSMAISDDDKDIEVMQEVELLSTQIMTLTLRYSIKDWRGFANRVKDENSKTGYVDYPLPMELETSKTGATQITSETYKGLAHDKNLCLLIYNAINEAVTFTDYDKKKLKSEQSSKGKDKSKVKSTLTQSKLKR